MTRSHLHIKSELTTRGLLNRMDEEYDFELESDSLSNKQSQKDVIKASQDFASFMNSLSPDRFFAESKDKTV